MKKFFGACLVALLAVCPSMAADFHPISGVTSTTSGTDLWPVSNLIQGPGTGFDAAEPHAKLVGGADGNWVTDACGFPCDYIGTTGTPVLTFDLGTDVLLGEISTWGYTTTNSNGVSQFSLRFATSAEGTAGFGTSIAYNPTFPMALDDISRESHAFSETVTARYVEFTALDNYFVAPGDGSGGTLAGGDRVGMGEVAFAVVPEPSSLSLLAFGILPLLRRRSR